MSTLSDLAESASTCTACDLHASRTQVVFSSGPEQAELVLLGEAPGAEEDEHGVPFVGRSGQLLTRLLHEVGFARDDLYVTNVVKCRPPGNRTPGKAEIASCASWLAPQMAALAPRLIVALGGVAASAALGVDVAITKVRGEMHTGPYGSVLPTLHPAYALRGGPRIVEMIRADLETAHRLVGAS